MDLSISQDIYGADGLTAEGEWILRAGRDEAAQEGRSEVIQLISKGERTADFLLREDISGKSWHVLLEDGLCNFRFFPVKESVFLTHFALQFGEFGDHAGREVGLGEEGGAVSVSGFRWLPSVSEGGLLYHACRPCLPDS